MIKPKLKICDGCDQNKVIWKNHEGKRFCRDCWIRHSQNKPVLTKNSFQSFPKINNKSQKKSKEDAVYSTLRKDFLLLKPTCEAKLEGCSIRSTDVHHRKGRGKYYLVTTTWLSACRSCHDYIENNPDQAKQMGFSESRLKN